MTYTLNFICTGTNPSCGRTLRVQNPSEILVFDLNLENRKLGLRGAVFK